MISIIHSQSKLSENDSLEKLKTLVYSELTTIFEGNRNPYPSGIFLSTFYHSKQWQALKGVFHYLKAELVAWAICGNKAQQRTNNASRSKTVVEPMLHPYRGLQVLLTNFFEGISMLYTFFYTATRLKITIYAQTLAQAYARKPAGNAVLVIRQKGGCYA